MSRSRTRCRDSRGRALAVRRPLPAHAALRTRERGARSAWGLRGGSAAAPLLLSRDLPAPHRPGDVVKGRGREREAGLPGPAPDCGSNGHTRGQGRSLPGTRQTPARAPPAQSPTRLQRVPVGTVSHREGCRLSQVTQLPRWNRDGSRVLGPGAYVCFDLQRVRTRPMNCPEISWLTMARLLPVLTDLHLGRAWGDGGSGQLDGGRRVHLQDGAPQGGQVRGVGCLGLCAGLPPGCSGTPGGGNREPPVSRGLGLDVSRGHFCLPVWSEPKVPAEDGQADGRAHDPRWGTARERGAPSSGR